MWIDSSFTAVSSRFEISFHPELLFSVFREHLRHSDPEKQLSGTRQAPVGREGLVCALKITRYNRNVRSGYQHTNARLEVRHLAITGTRSLGNNPND